MQDVLTPILNQVLSKGTLTWRDLYFLLQAQDRNIAHLQGMDYRNLILHTLATAIHSMVFINH